MTASFDRLREVLKQAALDLHEAAGRFATINKLDAKRCSELTREAARRADAALAARMGTSEESVEELKAALGYMINAKIDLETGATKATAIRTLEGGIERIRKAIDPSIGGQDGR